MPRTYCTSSSIIDLSHIQYYTDLSHLSEKLKNSFVGARYWICNTTKLKELLCGVFWIKEKILQQLMPTSILSFFSYIAVTFWKFSLPGVPFFVLSDFCSLSLLQMIAFMSTVTKLLACWQIADSWPLALQERITDIMECCLTPWNCISADPKMLSTLQKRF